MDAREREGESNMHTIHTLSQGGQGAQKYPLTKNSYLDLSFGGNRAILEMTLWFIHETDWFN